MALNRRASSRFETSAWPGYVDALATLLMVLMFSLTIFMVVQTVLRDQITVQDDTIADQVQRLSLQDRRLDDLGTQVAALSQALSASRDEARDRAQRITQLTGALEDSRAALDGARSRLTDFEAEVAALIAARQQDQAAAQTERAALQQQLSEQVERASAAELAVAAARSEIDAATETARLAAARRDALTALVEDLRRRNAQAGAEAEALQTRLSEAETARLTDAAAAAALRERLQGADAELTAMTLALEESRRKAEETLTLLAAAQAARDDTARAAEAEQARQADALATARAELSRQEQVSADGQRRVALLNEQVASLTARLGSVQALLDAAGDQQEQAELRVTDLGRQLNAALLLAAEEKDRRLKLETEARTAAEAEARDLARYRSEFFGRLSQILQGRPGISVVGDRFVFDSSVLFQPGEADLSQAGRDQIDDVTQLLDQIAAEIPSEIDWIIRVDGHTDSTPLSGTGRYRDNWELSQARALAVVRYMADTRGFPRNRLLPAGFADTRPAVPGNTPDALAQNRRIELKLTER